MAHIYRIYERIEIEMSALIHACGQFTLYYIISGDIYIYISTFI